jgi:molybdenum ABC transporter molybdate-binding protein
MSYQPIYREKEKSIMRSKVLSLLMLIVLLASACTSQVTPAAPTIAPTAAPATEVPATQAPAPTAAPTAVPVALTAQPTDTAAPKQITLNVFAAASLTAAFGEIGTQFEAANPGVKVVNNFAGSQQLAAQINQGAPADVFASASTAQMTAVITTGEVISGSQQLFTRNRLVVIYPTENPGKITKLQDLANSGLKLVLADKTVPVGAYALTFLDNAVKDASFGADYKTNVLKNVVSYENDVKSVLAKVQLGEGDAGIVYTTDAATADPAKVSQLAIPDALNVIAKYPIAPVKSSVNPESAKAYIAFVLSPSGQTVLAKYGFIPPAAKASSSSASGGFTVTDALGRNVTFKSVPQKIVLAGKALFMIADAVYTFPDASKNIVALGSTAQGSGNFIPMIDSTFAAKISLDSNAGAEQIAAAQPDCVITKSYNQSTLGKALEAINIPVIYLDFETPDQYQRDLKTLGQLFQNPDRAAQVAAFYQGKVDAVTKAVSTLKDDQKPRTLILYYNVKDNAVSFNVPPMTWIQTLMVTTAGGAPVWQDANPGSGWTKVSLEQVAAWNPDVIFIVSYFKPVNDVVKELKADSQWQALSAVKNSKLYGFATDVYSWDESDTRWILGLTWVAGKLHPDLFPGLDITKEAQTFYKDLYAMDDASYQKNIQPLLTGDVN